MVFSVRYKEPVSTGSTSVNSVMDIKNVAVEVQKCITVALLNVSL
jgi:hypothetical protein